MDLLLLIILTSLFIWGVYASFYYRYNAIDDKAEDQMIFGDIAFWLDKKLPLKIIKPLYGCPACMSTVWTPIVWFVFLGLDFDREIFVVWVVVAGLNYLIGKKI